MTERPAEEEVEANNQRKVDNEGSDNSLVDRDLQDVGIPLPGIATDDDDADPERLRQLNDAEQRPD